MKPDFVLVIDNYDSFTYNLVHYLEILGAKTLVKRNDAITLEVIESLSPTHILISPGPCTPNEAGISKAVIEHCTGRFPILGVCLGHQCIGEVFGGRVVRAPEIMHGKVSNIFHKHLGIFKDIKSPFIATRYHSLMISQDQFPHGELEITAQTEDEIIMAVQHKTNPLFGVQFHPESIASEHGFDLLRQFLKI